MNVIDNLMYLISNMFLTYVLFRFIGVFFDRTLANRKIEAIACTAFYLINSTAHLLFTNPFVNLGVTLTFLFGVTCLYQGSLLKKLLSSVLIYAFCILIDTVTYNIFLKIAVRNNLKDSMNIISSLLLFAIALVLERILHGKATPKLNLTHWLATLLIPTGSVIIIIIAFFSNFHIVATIVMVSILLGINVLVFYLYGMTAHYYESKYEKNLLRQQNSAYKNQFKIMIDSQENLRILRHDMKNHLYAMQLLLESGKKQELSNYLSSALGAVDLATEFVRSGNAEVDSILNYKLLEAKRAGADIEVTLKIPSELKIDIFDLTAILGNLMDNAVEALKVSKEKKLFVEILLERSLLYITVINSFSENLCKKNGKFLTTKAGSKGHGVGLESVEATMKKYSGSMSVNTYNGNFAVNLMVYDTALH